MVTVKWAFNGVKSSGLQSLRVLRLRLFSNVRYICKKIVHHSAKIEKKQKKIPPGIFYPTETSDVLFGMAIYSNQKNLNKKTEVRHLKKA